MRKDIIHKWCLNLESGEFKQGQYTLARPSVEEDPNSVVSYCCLGLLAETCKRDFPDVVQDYDIRFVHLTDSDRYRMEISRKDGETFQANGLLNELRIKGCLPDRLFNKIVEGFLSQEQLIRRNDGTFNSHPEEGWSFKQIAEFIREQTGVPVDFSADASQQEPSDGNDSTKN